MKSCCVFGGITSLAGIFLVAIFFVRPAWRRFVPWRWFGPLKNSATKAAVESRSPGNAGSDSGEPISERELFDRKRLQAVADLLMISLKPELQGIANHLQKLDFRIGSIELELVALRPDRGKPLETVETDPVSLRGSHTVPEHAIMAEETIASHTSWSADSASEAFRTLCEKGIRGLDSGLVFGSLDIDASSATSKEGEVMYRFKKSESKQSAFVIFESGTNECYLFPNPLISFTEAIGYVFRELSYDNFEAKKDRVRPLSVQRLSSSAWEMT